MSLFTWLWIGWGLAFVAVEGIALFNSKRGDTLSEHAWAWLGVGSFQRRNHTADVCTVCGTRIARPAQGIVAYDPGAAGMPTWVHIDGYDTSRYGSHFGMPGFITPKWTLRVARIILISFMVWLTLHFVTGGWV